MDDFALKIAGSFYACVNGTHCCRPGVAMVGKALGDALNKLALS